MFRGEVRTKIAEELSRGAAARQAGLEGRARVCARRAAGEAIREFLAVRGLPQPGPSAIDLLTFLPSLAQPGGILEADRLQIQQAADHLLARVDEDYSLPADIDLLAEAGRLVQVLEHAAGRPSG